MQEQAATTPAVRGVLTRLEARMLRERETLRAGGEFDPDQFMLPIGRDAGQLLSLLIKLGRATRILEVGTSVGYSTVWLAAAAAATGGKVFSTEAVPAKHRQARENLTEAGLIGRVEMHTGDALATIHRLAGPFDFVLIDLWKDLYIPALRALAPKLAPGAIIAADNMLEPQSARADAGKYRRAVASLPDLETVLLPIGHGIELTRKRAEDAPLSAPVRRVLALLERRMAQEEATRKRLGETEYRRRLGEFMLAIGHDSGRFLHLLAKLGRCTRILELGTSAGYSTLWLADAARATGGRVVTVDHSAAKHREARDYLAAAELAGRVELVTADVLPTLDRLPGPFDFVLLDYDRSQFITVLEKLLPKLCPGALIAADNMLEPQATRPAADAYRAYLAARPDLETVLVPIGNGVEITRKLG